VLTWAMCELAALTRDVFGPGCLGKGVTVRRARQLTARLTTWMHRDFQGMLGRPCHEYPVSKHIFGYEPWRTCTHAIYRTNPTQTHWHDRLTLVPIPKKT